MYFKGKPLYPFGHGLSYTVFKYDNLQLSDATLSPEGTITVSLNVTNMGDVEGDEVVQLYVHAASDTNKLVLPIKQLVNFERIRLKPRETKGVKFALPHSERALHYWDDGSRMFARVKGSVDLMVGSSSQDIRLTGQVQMG
jgi:beta-glucosidase